MNKIELINETIKKIKAFKYLEVGMGQGYTYNQIECKKKTGIDPDFNGTLPGAIKIDSDTFFKQNRLAFDVIFIDGLHTYEQSKKDVLSSLEHLSKKGVIILHDCLPPHKYAAWPRFTPGEWCGEVYKTIIWLRSSRKDLNIKVLNHDYGLGVVKFGKPDNMLRLKDKEIDEMDFEIFNEDKINLLNLY